MPENRDHFFSEIKNTYINIFCIKLLKVIMAATQLFQCFSFPKQSFLLPSFISFIFPHPSIYPIIGYPFSIHQSSIHPSIIHPTIHSFILLFSYQYFLPWGVSEGQVCRINTVTGLCPRFLAQGFQNHFLSSRSVFVFHGPLKSHLSWC